MGSLQDEVGGGRERGGGRLGFNMKATIERNRGRESDRGRERATDRE